MCEIVAAQNDQHCIREFLVATRSFGTAMFPDAIAAAIDKLDDSDQASLVSLFKRLFTAEKQNYSMPRDFALRVYDHIADPDEEIVGAALKYSDANDFMKILSKVRRQDAFAKVFCDEELPRRVDKSDRTELYCPLDVIRSDVKLDTMRDLMAPVKDEAVLSRIALSSPLFNARYVAVEKMTSDCRLASVAVDRLNDCPYDTSASGYDLVSNRIDWMDNNERQSAMTIRKLAISRINGVEILRKLRCEDKDAKIKKAASERLVALGHSDAEEIIAATKYNRNLFSMLDEVAKEDDLKKIAANAKLRGVRLIAASRLKGGLAQEIVDKEAHQIGGECPVGHINIGGFYLGLNIEDAYALILSRYGDVKPTLYLDGGTLCIADGSGREASSLLAAIEQAQAVLDNAESTVGDLLTADEALQAALDNYHWLNASETNPVDCTNLFLTNPSFEDGTSGWTVKGMSTQSNNVFSQKEGTYYLEAWTSIGNKIGNT